MFFSYFLCSLLTNVCFQGEGAPSDVEPAALRKEGLKRSNTSTFTPRTSKELQQHMEEYIRLEECFQDVFRWIKETVCLLHAISLGVILIFI